MAKKVKSELYYVQGMHCSACELLIKNVLEESSFVTSVHANLSDKTVTITKKKGSKNNLAQLNKVLEGTGYCLTSHKSGAVTWNQSSIVLASFTILLILVIYLFLKAQGYLAAFSITETSSLTGFFVFGIIAGVSSCAALVGGLLLSLSQQWSSLYAHSEKFITKAAPFTMFNVGRLVSYALLGGVLGLVGSAFQLSLSTTAALTLVVSLFMILIALQMLGVSWANKVRFQLPQKWLSNLSTAKSFKGKYMPFLAGAGTFFLPCGFTLIAQTIALTTGSFWASSAIMFTFALGTLPPLAIISITSLKLQSNQSYAGTFNLIVGIMILLFGIYNINSQLIVLGMPNLSTLSSVTQSINTNDPGIDEEGLGSEVKTVDGTKIQEVFIKASGFYYYPRELTLSSNITTTMTIQSENVFGCAQAMSLPGLFDDIVYLNKPRQEISFVPQKGTYYISCSMGMVQPIVVKVI